MNIKASLCFHICRYLSNLENRKRLKKKSIYLTFDDGPEPGITEAVLNTLKKYDAKATFFCCGKNCEKYPELFQRIKDEGHVIANHTYSHIRGLSVSTDYYLADVEKGATACDSTLFRPPWGGASLLQYIKLQKKHTFVYWDLTSGDTQREKFDLAANVKRLRLADLAGKIILFHFCKLHEKETMQILPAFLELIQIRGLETEIIKR